MAHRLEEYYENHLVHKSLILCGDDVQTEQLAHELRQLDFPVSTLTRESIEDDHPNAMDPVLLYASRVSEVFIVNYTVFMQLFEIMENHIFPYCSLIALYGFDDDTIDYIARRLYDAGRRGFFGIHGTPHLLMLDADEIIDENIDPMIREP